MAIPKELYDMISEDEKAIPPERIVAGLASSKNFPDVANNVRQDLQSGMKPKDILAAMKSSYGEPTQEPSTVNKIGSAMVSAGDYLENKVKPAIKPYVKDALGYGGMTLGGTLGPLGAGLGYAGGNQLGNVYEAATGVNEDKQPKTLGESFKKTGKEVAIDVPTGAFMQWANTKIEQGMSKLAKNIYQFVAKPSKTIPIDAVNSATEVALDKGVPIAERGIEQAKNAISSINSNIDKIAADLTASGKNINSTDVLKRLDDLVVKAGNSPLNKQEKLTAIAEAKKVFVRDHGAELTPTAVQDMKKAIYEEIIAAKSAAYTAGSKVPFDVQLQKQVGRGLKEELGSAWPEINNLNEKEAAWINLKKIINDAVSRERNKYPIGQLGGATLGGALGYKGEGGGKGAAEGAFTGYVLMKALQHPEVASKLARAIWVGSKAPTKAIAFAGGKGINKLTDTVPDGGQE